MPPDSVRGRVRAWIERHADKLGADVLEVGSRLHDPGAWWLVNRDLARGNWTGIDMQCGPGVDEVADIHALAPEWEGRFSGILCSEVLEHVARPWPIHGFPDDFYRYTQSGLRLLLEDAGFAGVETVSAGEIHVQLDDHGGGGLARRTIPMHVFAVGRRP
ncbi:MAG: hypothetical protein PWP11_3353 [Thauera sp.]|nr:hypothetical protein [Thauera sp.]